VRLFTLIVICSGWFETARTCKEVLSAPDRSGGRMTEISRTKHKDLKGHGDTPPVRERTIAMRGNMLDSKELFSGSRELIIAHGSESYRLRLTSQNKLILTK
jgi:hemin uptake protein HemP